MHNSIGSHTLTVVLLACRCMMVYIRMYCMCYAVLLYILVYSIYIHLYMVYSTYYIHSLSIVNQPWLVHMYSTLLSNNAIIIRFWQSKEHLIMGALAHVRTFIHAYIHRYIRLALAQHSFIHIYIYIIGTPATLLIL